MSRLTSPQPVESQPAKPQRIALVLGITGGYGGALAAELLRRGWAVRALVRDLDRGQRAVTKLTADDLPGRVTLVRGDLHDSDALARAGQGARVIVHGVNAPYHRWEQTLVPYAQVIADLAARSGATILFPGNVYNYAANPAITEDTLMAPPTRMGELRVAQEAALHGATARGARLILLRGGDFFGVGHAGSWLAQILKNVHKPSASLLLPGEAGVAHQWCYLPDFAACHVDLLERQTELPADARFHFAGHVVTPEQLRDALRLALDQPARRFSAVPWRLYRGLGVFVPVLREVVKMRYLWDEEVILRQDKLAAFLPALPSTPLVEALRAEAGV